MWIWTWKRSLVEALHLDRTRSYGEGSCLVLPHTPLLLTSSQTLLQVKSDESQTATKCCFLTELQEWTTRFSVCLSSKSPSCRFALAVSRHTRWHPLSEPSGPDSPLLLRTQTSENGRFRFHSPPSISVMQHPARSPCQRVGAGAPAGVVEYLYELSNIYPVKSIARASYCRIAF